MAPTFFTTLDGDVILRVSEGSGLSSDFRVHRLLLSLSSPIFKDMFELASPTHQTIPVVEISDSPQVIDLILRFIYPGVEPPEVEELETLTAVLVTATKYRMGGIVPTLRKSLKAFLPSESIAVYLLARRFGFKEEAKEAAQSTAIWMFGMDGSEEEVNQVSSATLYRLFRFISKRAFEGQLEIERALRAPLEDRECRCSEMVETRVFYHSLAKPIAQRFESFPCPGPGDLLRVLDYVRDPPRGCEPGPDPTEGSSCPLMWTHIRITLEILAVDLRELNGRLLDEFFD